ncbi:MAG TPA: integrin alpha, partial [Candidatus Eisenbacteria bacterium]|nr:integrin alpha [Candidatus Eisenbacteria bacterium]
MSHMRVLMPVLATWLIPSGAAWGNLGMLTGEQSGDQFGRAVAAAGDVNGDGLADFLVGAPGGRGAGGVVGTVSLFLGAADSVFEPPALVFEGETAGDEFGYAVAGAGDVDNDGYDDFVV